MKEEFSSGASWNAASLAGLAMAAVTVAFIFLQNIIESHVSGVAGGFLAFVLWAAKLITCVMLFRWLMIRFFNRFDKVDGIRLKNYGMKIALFSAILVAGYSLVDILFLHPETYQEAISTALQSYSSMLDSNTASAIEQTKSALPAISFFSSLIYCFVFGWILSGIFARMICPSDPFSDLFKGRNGNGSSEGNQKTDNNQDTDNQ